MTFNEKEFYNLMIEYRNHFGRVFPYFEYPKTKHTMDLIKHSLQTGKLIEEIVSKEHGEDVVF